MSKRKITLTVSVSLSRITTDSKVKQVSQQELLNSYAEFMTIPFQNQIKVLIQCLKDNPQDIVLENAIHNCTDYEKLKKGLLKEKELIEKVFISYPQFDKDAYVKQYSLHARWMDYSPEAAEKISDDYVSDLKTLEVKLRADKIEVEIISS